MGLLDDAESVWNDNTPDSDDVMDSVEETYSDTTSTVSQTYNDSADSVEQTWNSNTPDLGGSNSSPPRTEEDGTDSGGGSWLQQAGQNVGDFARSQTSDQTEEYAAEVREGTREAGDFLAGSTDEAIARSTDDEAGGGAWSGTVENLDNLAGSTDEAVARQTDDQSGGGLADGAQEFGSGLQSVAENTFGAFKGTGDAVRNLATGRETVGEVSASAGETIVNAATGGEARQWREEFRQQEGDIDEAQEQIQSELARDDAVGNVAAFNTAARVGIDAMVDNPRGPNVQDAGRAGARWLTRSENNEQMAERTQGAFGALESGKQGALNAVGLSDDRSESQVGWAAGGLYDVFVKDPISGGITAATGVDPETGEQEARAEPADVADIALFGGGKLASGAAKGAKAARGSRAVARLLSRGGDEAAAGADEAARGSGAAARTADEGASLSDEAATPSDDAANSASGGDSDVGIVQRGVAGLATAGAAAVGGSKGVRAMGKFSFIDEALSGSDELAGATDEGLTGSDEVASGIDDRTVGSLDTIDSFDDLSRSVGTGGDASRFSEDLTDTSTVMEEGAQAGAKTGDSSTSIDSFIDMTQGSDETFRMADETASGADEAAATADEGATATQRTLDDLFSSTSSTVDEVSSGVDDFFQSSRSTVDDATSKAGDLFARGGDEAASGSDEGGSLLDNFLSGGDETASTTDETASTADETTSTADETASGADEGATLLDDPVGYFTGKWDDVGLLGKGILGGLGALAVADFAGVTIGPPTGVDDPGPTGQERYRPVEVKTYDPFGTLFDIHRGVEGNGWQSQGYALVIGNDPEGELVSAGSIAVLATNARPVEMSPVASTEQGDVPQARFNNVGSADDAFERFIAWLQEQNNGDGSEDGTPDPEQNPNLDGNLSVPDTVQQGEQFSAQWEATLTGAQNALSGRLTLALATQDGLVPLGESDFTLGGGNSTSDSGSFDVPSGWPAVEPQSYDIHAVIMQNGEPAGALASSTIEVTGEGGGGGGQENPWGDPQMVQELPAGWYLFAQSRQNTDETRFMVVGQRDDGTNIYLQSGGNVAQSPHFFPTAEAAAQSLQQWMQRAQNGNVREGNRPSEGAGRPDSSDVKKDAAGQDENSLSGLVDRLSGAARNNPVMFAGGTAITLGIAYYLYTEGYFETTKLPGVN